MNQFEKAIKLAVGKSSLTLKKYSPEILITVGIGSLIGAGVMACRATLKADAVLEDHAMKMEKIEEVNANPDVYDAPYTEEDYRKDKQIMMVQTSMAFVKLYGPAITLGVVGIVCILGGNNIMRKRYVATMAAYKLVEQTFADYRKRVVTELGVDKDTHFRYGTTIEEITETVVDEETGKKKKVTTTEQILNGVACSGYARLFANPLDGDNEFVTTQWCPKDTTSGDINLMFLRKKQEWLNEKLDAYGHVFLNEVYEELGFTPTQAGQVVGWVKGNGDGYISFGDMVDKLTDPEGRAFTHDQIRYRKGDPVLLDFNVDGVVWDIFSQS